MHVPELSDDTIYPCRGFSFRTMSPSKLAFCAVLLLCWWVMCVTIAILAARLSLVARAPVHSLHKPRIPVLPAAHSRFTSSMVKRHKLAEGCVACHQYEIHGKRKYYMCFIFFLFHADFPRLGLHCGWVSPLVPSYCTLLHINTTKLGK